MPNIVLAKKPCCMVSYGHAETLGGGSVVPDFVGWRRALSHKYQVGETVYFTTSNVSRPAADGTFEIVRLLPTDGDDCQYRIKNSAESFERVARESQLAVR